VHDGEGTTDTHGSFTHVFTQAILPRAASCFRADLAVIEDVEAWQSRPLEAFYPILNLDGPAPAAA
jgi:transposase-like protein